MYTLNNNIQSYPELIKHLTHIDNIATPRNLEIKEELDVKIEVKNNEVLISCPGIRDLTDRNAKPAEYLAAEFVWYMSGDRTTDFISNFGSMWSKLTNTYSNVYKTLSIPTDGLVNSNYGYSVFYKSVYDKLIYDNNNNVADVYDAEISPYTYVYNELRKDINSRKAIIQYTQNNIYLKGTADFTCTQTQHFVVRNNYLYNMINIRSSDVIKGLTFDMPWWDFVGQLLAMDLNINYYGMSINIGSSHLYKTDYELAHNISESVVNMKTLKLKNKNDIINNLINFILPLYEEYMYTYIPDCEQMTVLDLITTCCYFIVNHYKTDGMTKDAINALNFKLFDCIFDIA